MPFTSLNGDDVPYSRLPTLARMLLVCAALLLGDGADTRLSAQTNTFPASGNVGIGTTSPGNPLHVHVGTDQNILIGTFQGVPYLQSVNDAINTSQPMQFLGSRFLFQGFGVYPAVGIGTATPASYNGNVGTVLNADTVANLNTVFVASSGATSGSSAGGIFEVRSNLQTNGDRRLGQLHFVRVNDQTSGKISSVMDVYVNNDGALLPAMRINPNGNVGIGTTTPQYKFAVAATGDPNDYVAIHMDSNNGPGIIEAKYDTTGSNVLALNPSGGNVGVGTTNPGSYRLAVEGKIGAREVVVTSTTPWSDYVLKPGYRLRPLSEVASYIKQHQHLPEIPSEQEVKEKGVSVGEMQAKLLAKIEELTLHVIQQEKENRILRDRVERLESQRASTSVAEFTR